MAQHIRLHDCLISWTVLRTLPRSIESKIMLSKIEFNCSTVKPTQPSPFRSAFPTLLDRWKTVDGSSKERRIYIYLNFGACTKSKVKTKVKIEWCCDRSAGQRGHITSDRLLKMTEYWSLSRPASYFFINDTGWMRNMWRCHWWKAPIRRLEAVVIRHMQSAPYREREALVLVRKQFSRALFCNYQRSFW